MFQVTTNYINLQAFTHSRAVCGHQMALFNEMDRFFLKHNAKVVGISVDSKWCHMDFSENLKLHFPLLSDFEPKGFVARFYRWGKFHEKKDCSLRSRSSGGNSPKKKPPHPPAS